MSRTEVRCGIDEAGRGPVIGPMVMSIVCGDPEEIRAAGARDSKKLTPAKRESVAKLIKERFNCRIRVISVPEINTWMETRTINELEEKVALELISCSDGDVYVDSFDVNPARLSALLSNSSGKRVICMHRADETVPAVSAASVISKVERDRIIKELTKTYGNMGSGYPSDPVTIGFLRRSIREGSDLMPIVRKNWKTYRRLLAENAEKKLF